MSAKYWRRLSHETELWRQGLSLVAGGTKKETLTFNRTAVGMSAGMLALAVVGRGQSFGEQALHDPRARRRSSRVRGASTNSTSAPAAR